MQVGVVGLGKMGAGIARRLCRADIHVVGHDLGAGALEALAGEPGFEAAWSVDGLLLALKAPRTVWCMLPSGEATQGLLDELRAKLAPGDRVVDGANGHYRDAMANAARFEAAGIGFADAGVSGGVWGLENGYALMLGGAAEDVAALGRVFGALAPKPGQWLHCGPAGAGHFVKMIHNGIEYGMMQALAEGFDILRNAGKSSLGPEHRYAFDLADIAEVWRRGSVVSSWLLDLAAAALAEDRDLSGYGGAVEDSGEGRWTVQAAVDTAVPAQVLTAALYARFRSRQDHGFADKMLSALRKQFGGHVEAPARRTNP